MSYAGLVFLLPMTETDEAITAERNIGFDPKKGITRVTMDLTQERDYMEVAEK